MAFEETKEQQQMYNYFRSCIYFFLIIEIVMNLPITADNKIRSLSSSLTCSHVSRCSTRLPGARYVS